MARRKSYTTIMNQIAREQARAQKEAEKAHRKAIQEQERAEREALRERIRQEKELARQNKEAKQRYIQARMEEAEAQSQDIAIRLKSLQTILQHTLSVDDTIKFDDLRIKDEFPPLIIPTELQKTPDPPERSSFFKHLKPPSVFEKLIPGAQARYQSSLQKADQAYQTAMMAYQQALEEREEKIRKIQEEYEQDRQAYLQKVQQRELEVQELEKGYQCGDPEAVLAYNTMVLERSEYPDGFPQEFRLAYVPESKELVIEYELPGVDIIPTASEYSYVKAKDVIVEKSRKPSEIKELYQDIVASVCLRTIHEVSEADQNGHIDVVVFNGFVQTIDPSTGRDIRPCLISVRTTRNTYQELNLARVHKKACLRNLGAQVSPRPAEMQPVKPLIEFDMVDSRYIEGSDVLEDLESRPNLMELSPFEFENLVTNLFSRMGLETKQTRSAKDGGVDAVAFDTRPILGGKVVIQAKRYKNVVGVSAVRDLYGTMQHEGANKGILVTTSHYGPDAYDFTKDKPIELIDGGGLLYLLDQVGVKAKIVMPDD